MTGQSITEATANKLNEHMQELTVAIAVLTEKLETQNKWNQEQQKINISVADKLEKISEGNVKRDSRLDALEGWRNWLSGVMTAILTVVLIAVVVAGLYLTYGGHP